MKLIKRLLLWMVIAATVAVAGMTYYANRQLALPQVPYEFTLRHGSSLTSVARQLSDAGVLQESWQFIILARLYGKASEIKAGSYELEQNLTSLQLLRMISRGDVSQSEIAFIEGWTFKQMRKALDEHQAVRHETAGLSEHEILVRIGAQENAAEGMFFPDTYYFSAGMSDLDILRRAHQLMQVRFAEAWRERAPDLPYTNPYEAMIMASIVEKESGRNAERPLIAGVFINRLHLGMKLQTDPTVIYGMGDAYSGNIRKKDLLTDTTYNTYTRMGLPPTPIAMPGAAAIYATLHPAKTSALYFVGRNDGTHQFSSNLAEHNRAVARYQKR